MTYNVHSCVGTDRLRSPRRIAEVIAEYSPDVVALQELDVGRARSDREDQVQLIAEALQMEFHFHAALRVAEEKYGDALLSKLPLRLVRADMLPTPPCRHLRETRGALWAGVTAADVEWQIITTHFGLARAERLAQAVALLGGGWIADARLQPPLVVCGDFNSHPRGRTYRLLAQHLTPVRPQPPGRTYPSKLPLIAVDHIFCGAGVRALSCSAPRTALTRLASDHLPLIAELEFTPAPLPANS